MGRCNRAANECVQIVTENVEICTPMLTYAHLPRPLRCSLNPVEAPVFVVFQGFGAGDGDRTRDVQLGKLACPKLQVDSVV